MQIETDRVDNIGESDKSLWKAEQPNDTHGNNNDTLNIETPKRLIGTSDHIKDLKVNYCWLQYDIEQKEIDYLKDFISTNKDSVSIDMLLRSENQKTIKKPESVIGGTDNRLVELADQISQRMINFGCLDDEKNVIKRKKHNNEKYYEEDDFINDHNSGFQIQKLVEKYSDFFVFNGSKEDFEHSAVIMAKLNELSIIKNQKKIKKNYKKENKVAKVEPSSNTAQSPTPDPSLALLEQSQSKSSKDTKDTKDLKQVNITSFFVNKGEETKDKKTIEEMK